MCNGWNIKVSKIKKEEIPGRYVVTHVTPRGILNRIRHAWNNLKSNFMASREYTIQPYAPPLAIKIRGKHYAQLMNIDPELAAEYCAVEGGIVLVPAINMGGETHAVS